MIASAVLAALAQPVTPGQSPIPVVVIQQGHEGMTTGELWVTASAFVLAAVTLLTAIHVDVVLHHLLRLVRAITPPLRRPLPGRVLYTSTDNGETGRVDKAMGPRDSA